MSKVEQLSKFSPEENEAISALTSAGIVTNVFRMIEANDQEYSCHLRLNSGEDVITRHGATMLQAIEAARQVAEVRWPEKF